MLDDLKRRLAGFDRKRLYTAGAALVVAGAAGHFMQQSANSAGDTSYIAGSVPGEAQPVATEEPVMTAANPGIAEDAVPAEVDPVTELVEVVTSPEEPLPEVDLAENGPVTIEAEAIPEVGVTRNEAEPVLAVPEAAETEAPMVLAAAEIESPVPEMVREPAAEPMPVLAPLDETVRELTDPVVTMPARAEEPAVDLCAITMDAVASPGALVSLSIQAPCNSGGEVRITHAGLVFSEQLYTDGSLDITVPAFTTTAEFVAVFDDGATAKAATTVSDMAGFDRIAIVWKGATGLQLHALEGGATYGAPGHVWAETPASPETAIAGEGGFLSVLGSTADGFAADVYTYPVDLTLEGQEPQVSIEAQVMENTCDTRIEGTILRSTMQGAPSETSLAMAVPGCDAVGEYLVLHNLPQDLKIAAR